MSGGVNGRLPENSSEIIFFINLFYNLQRGPITYQLFQGFRGGPPFPGGGGVNNFPGGGGWVSNFPRGRGGVQMLISKETI